MSRAERHPGPLRTLRQLPGPLRVLLCGIALNRMGSFVALFLVPYLTSHGYRPVVAGTVLTAFGLGAVTGSFAGGSITGRYGARNAIVLSTALSSLAIALLGLVTAYIPLLLISCAAGLLTQVYRPAATTLIAELTPPDRLVLTSAAVRLGLNVGAAAAPLLGAWLLGYSYSAIFVVNAVTSMGFAIVARIALPDTARASRGAAAPAASERYADVLRDRRFLLVIVAMFLTAFVEVQYQAVLPLQIEQRGLPLELYGAVVAVNGALVILLELPLTPFVQRLPMHLALALGTALIGGGLSLFGFSAGAWLLFAGSCVWTFGEIISAPSIVAYPALAAPQPAMRSRYIGALVTAQMAGYAVGPSVGTALFQVDGSAVWAMCGLLGVIGFAVMWHGTRSTSVAQAEMA
jgi:MFS family permease